MSLHQSGVFLKVTKEEQVYQSTPALYVDLVGKMGYYPSWGTNPS
jgi:hypothetical protein